MRPLLAWPTLSTSARSLRGTPELDVQYLLAANTYQFLLLGVESNFLADRMWMGHEGALLYWWGCLAAQKPQGPMECPDYVAAWVAAYRAGEMAVGPLPWWLGDTGFHLACQAQLIANDVRYAGNFVHAPLEMAYKWPLEKVGEWQWSL